MASRQFLILWHKIDHELLSPHIISIFIPICSLQQNAISVMGKEIAFHSQCQRGRRGVANNAAGICPAHSAPSCWAGQNNITCSETIVLSIPGPVFDGEPVSVRKTQLPGTAPDGTNFQGTVLYTNIDGLSRGSNTGCINPVLFSITLLCAVAGRQATRTKFQRQSRIA
jgi:hypothetical protein